MFKTRYSARVPSKGHDFTGVKSLTLQSEYPQTTIDYYLKRYSATGVLGDPVRAQAARFEDVSEMLDFQEMQDKVLQIKNAFMDLPSEERRKYGDDPQAWIQDQYNKQLEKMAKEQEAKLAEQAKKAAEAAKPAEKPAESGSSAS